MWDLNLALYLLLFCKCSIAKKIPQTHSSGYEDPKCDDTGGGTIYDAVSCHVPQRKTEQLVEHDIIT